MAMTTFPHPVFICESETASGDPGPGAAWDANQHILHALLQGLALLVLQILVKPKHVNGVWAADGRDVVLVVLKPGQGLGQDAGLDRPLQENLCVPRPRMVDRVEPKTLGIRQPSGELHDLSSFHYSEQCDKRPRPCNRIKNMDNTVQIVGLTEAAIRIPIRHIHGDKQALEHAPDRVHVYIRKPLARKARTLTEPQWRRLRSQSSLPAASKPSPTLFHGQVYPHVQHALLACLLRHHRGDTQYRYHPHQFPMFLADGPHSLCAPVLDAPMGLHWLPDEPSHAQLLEYGHRLRETTLRWCMLLVGTPQPVHSRWPADRPQIRGILLDATRFVDGTALREGSVQSGWYACMLGSVMFAMNGEHAGQALPPALLSPLSTLGLCLWKRSDGAHAIDQPTKQPGTWNQALKQQNDAPFALHDELIPEPSKEPKRPAIE